MREQERIQKKIDENLMALSVFIGDSSRSKESVLVAKTFYGILAEIHDSIPKIVKEARESRAE